MAPQETIDKLYANLIPEEENGKIVYYKKRKVFPIFNPDGSLNKFNFITGGSWKRLFITLGVIAIIVLFLFDYRNNLGRCSEVLKAINDLNLRDQVKTYLISKR